MAVGIIILLVIFALATGVIGGGDAPTR
jgi:hypothetical protein